MKEYFVIDNSIAYRYRELFYHIELIQLPKMLQYYTIWGLLAHVLLPDTHNFLICKFQMAMQIACGGFYICYVHPKYLSIPFLRIAVIQNPLYISDFISHYLPFFYYCWFYKIHYVSFLDFLIGYIPLLSYLIFFDFYKMYHITNLDLFYLALLYILPSSLVGYLSIE